MSRVHLIPCVEDADNRPLRILLTDAHSIQQSVSVIQRLLIPLAEYIVSSFL